ncbi:hypothetical protein QQX09_11035 [Demequina sp. SYSU T00192]|uniref:ABC transporter substrate-binding protein n=1 Tax=Demequina litoralis TaxID=3051660 RepID=A0ABT8GB68_9MICO|nr:hypothetical protein [Demequina sp. SYSU T00192]MDN4476390.1 hypothetical protein [Demequina sp. SYSU T00192]
MRKILLALAAIMVALASAAAGWFGVKAWKASQGDETPASAPVTSQETSGETVPLTFRLSEVEASGDDLFTPPACGETWTPTSDEANGVLPKVDASLRQVEGVDTVTVVPGYTTSTAGLGFLASEGSIIVTRDDVVVTPDWGGEFVPEYYVATPDETTLTQNNVEITGALLCDVADGLNEVWQGFDWSTATDDEIAAKQAEAAAFYAAHEQLPAGTYRVYQWSPIILGEPAAIARVLSEEGITGLAGLQYNAGFTALYDDPAVQAHCTDQVDADGNLLNRSCDVPEDVLADALEREVPVEYIADVPPAVAFSLAAEFTVE